MTKGIYARMQERVEAAPEIGERPLTGMQELIGD
jgi:hypothetical protein